MQQKKLMPLELALMVLCMLPLLVAFSPWRILWALPLIALAHNHIFSKRRKGMSFAILASLATGLIVMSFITNIWMDSPPNIRSYVSVVEWGDFDFGVGLWFVFDLLITLAAIIVGARLTFKIPKPDNVSVTMYVSHNGDTQHHTKMPRRGNEL